VTGLAFREDTHVLYSGSFDRTVKIWSLDDRSYVDTLYGHQSEVRCRLRLLLAWCRSLPADTVAVLDTCTVCSPIDSGIQQLSVSGRRCQRHHASGAGSGRTAGRAGADQRAGPHMPRVEGAGGIAADFQVQQCFVSCTSFTPSLVLQCLVQRPDLGHGAAALPGARGRTHLPHACGMSES
jgi:hypothetical protein